MLNKPSGWGIGAILLIFISAAPCSFSETIYNQEDAEDSNIAGWSIFDKRPEGKISNIIDPSDSLNRVIKLSGGGLKTGYKFSFNNDQINTFKLQVRVKFEEPFVIYVKCKTSRGKKVLAYYAGTDKISRWRRNSYKLSNENCDGEWHTILRNLAKDLQDCYRRNLNIISIDSILVRGSGLIDDIALREYEDADLDLIPDFIEENAGLDKNNPDDALLDMDGDKLNNLQEYIIGTEIADADSDDDLLTDYFEIKLSQTDPHLKDTDKDGTNDGAEDPDQDNLDNLSEQKAGMNPRFSAEIDSLYQLFFIEQKIIDDAESGTTEKWISPHRRIITNIVDPINDQNHLIWFKRSFRKPFLLEFQKLELTQFKLQWDMEIPKPFIVIVKCDTTQGCKTLYYTGTEEDWLERETYIHHGIGKEVKEGKRVTIHRDLQRDLADALPECRIISLNSFGVIGKGYIDNIITSAYADQDYDLIPDYIEDAAGLKKDDPEDALGDIDDDGENNLAEFYAGTLELSNLNDKDRDGLDDDWELKFFGNLDQDGKGDFDGDGLNNMQEMNYGTDPTKKDTDGDGMSDGDEIKAGRDPLNPDEDNDSLPDGWEMKYFGNLNQTPDGDPDNDKVNNFTEYKFGRHPNAGSRKDYQNQMKLYISTPLK